VAIVRLHASPRRPASSSDHWQRRLRAENQSPRSIDSDRERRVIHRLSCGPRAARPSSVGCQRTDTSARGIASSETVRSGVTHGRLLHSLPLFDQYDFGPCPAFTSSATRAATLSLSMDLGISRYFILGTTMMANCDVGTELPGNVALSGL
jgi:hypothetical protein